MTVRLWTPRAEVGRRLRAWYDFSDVGDVQRVHDSANPGNVVNTVRDRSGAARTLTQTINYLRPRFAQTRIAGRPVTTIAGGDFLDAVNTSSNAYNVGARGFMVAAVFRINAYTNGASNDGEGTYIWDRNSTGSGLPLWSLKCIGGNVAIQTRDNVGNYLLGLTCHGITAGRVELHSSRWCRPADDPQGLNARAWRAGASVYAAAFGDTTDLHPDSAKFGYGISFTGTSNVDDGEFVFFNDGLDNGLRQRVEGYLAYKWGVRLAAGHPYYQRPPLLLPDTSTALPNTLAARLAAGGDSLKARTSTTGARALFTLG